MADENILTRLGKLFQNQIVVRKTPTGQLKVKDVNFTQTGLTSNFIDRYTRLIQVGMVVLLIKLNKMQTHMMQLEKNCSEIMN